MLSLWVGSVGDLVNEELETRGRLEGRELGEEIPTEEPGMGEPFLAKSNRGDVVAGIEVCRGGFVMGNVLTERGLREGDLVTG